MTLFTALIAADKPATLYAKDQKTHYKLVAEAAVYGAVIVGMGKDRNFRLYLLACGHRQVVQTSKTRVGQFACQPCSDAKLRGEADADGRVKWLRQTRRSYGLFRFVQCGHEQEIQNSHVRQGKLKCCACQKQKFQNEVDERVVWLRQTRRAYGLFRFVQCGHEQEIRNEKAKLGIFACQQCGETWATKPSNVYVHLIRHSGIEVIKVGVAQDIRHRADGYGLPPDAEVITLRVWPFATGLLAKQAETNVKTRFASSRVDEGRLLLSKSGYTECFCPSVMRELFSFMAWDM
jgi:hypothetical protein